MPRIPALLLTVAVGLWPRDTPLLSCRVQSVKWEQDCCSQVASELQVHETVGGSSVNAPNAHPQPFPSCGPQFPHLLIDLML